MKAELAYQIAKELSSQELGRLFEMLQKDMASSNIITSSKKQQKFTDKQALDYLLKNTFNCR